MGSRLLTRQPATLPSWERARMREASPRSSSTCTRTASSSWTSTRMAPLTKMTKAEIDDIFGEFDIDEDYMVKTKEVLGLFVAQKEEEKKEEAPAPVEEAAPAEEDEGEAKKKKKKKKKAAK